MKLTRRTATLAGISALAGTLVNRTAWAGIADGDLNGWMFVNAPGRYGTESYSPEIGANREAIYLMSRSDANGNPYRRGCRYRIRFGSGLTPPVRGSWSITAYDSYFFFVPDRPALPAIGSHDSLIANRDGTIDIYVQNAEPTLERKANWLEAPDADFRLLLKMHLPDVTSPSILDGTWKPPAVGRVAYAYSYSPSRGT